MDEEKRIGRQTPTQSFVLPYDTTRGDEAIQLYESCEQTAIDWQKLLNYDILATDKDGLWVHSVFGYSIPRRNGKGEILTQRELLSLFDGDKCLHTAHRTDTSSDASQRLATLLDDMGYTEVLRFKKGETYEKSYVYAKQHGVEKITLLDTGGFVDFRTRTSSGGLGRGYDLLIIDEAQEYTQDQESTLKYTVTDSNNPQIIMCGTPPTNVSRGNVFELYRRKCLTGKALNSGWAEWSVEHKSDCYNVDLWYECNPSMGFHLNERKVSAEVGDDENDFNIQRLGWWSTYNQSSVITEKEWNDLEIKRRPKLVGKLHFGIKYSKSGDNVALSVACRTASGKIFVECIDCREVREGNRWLIEYLTKADYKSAVVDGQSGQAVLSADMKLNKIKKYKFPKVKEVIEANATFERGLYDSTIQHADQKSVFNVVTNTEKRAIGTNGGFGYKAVKSGIEIAILDSIILAYWSCATAKETRKQRAII